MALHTRAMLVNLSISQWTARKHDKKISGEVERNHGASGAGRYNKLLVPAASLEPVQRTVSAARTHLYFTTLPWGDNGDRLLPSNLYFQFTQDMRSLIADFDAAADDFVRVYPSLIAAAQRHLGTMYDPADYPDVHDIRSRFEARLDFSPVPDASDFRVEVDANAAEEIKASITEAVNARQEQAMVDVKKRMRDVVTRIEERLSVKDAIFRDTLIENARDLCELIPSLNITNDPELEALRVEMEENLLIQPETLRRDPDKRKETAKAASEILSRLGM